jgi:hypothetical protein
VTDDERERTPEERRILDAVAESRGEEFVAEFAELILTQARLVGELQDEE